MASPNVAKFLGQVIGGVYTDAEYGPRGDLIKPEKEVWKPTVKTWKTVYAICVEKIYSYGNNIIGYVLQDFSGNTLRVDAKKLKLAIVLNQIDVINLHVTLDDEDYGIPKRIKEIPKIDVKSYDELNHVIDKNEHSSYVVGNLTIGYFEIRYSELVDYKGYNEEIWLPKINCMNSYFLSFNDYVKIVHIPSSFNCIDIGMGYGSTALTDIYYDISGNALVENGVITSNRWSDVYKNLSERTDVNIHTQTLDTNTKEFADLMSRRNDLSVMLKIKLANADSSDPLQAYIIKSKMINKELFNINFSRRSVEQLLLINKDIEDLKIPPVRRLRSNWYYQCGNIGTLYLPSTLEMKELTLFNIPNDVVSSTYDDKTKRNKYTYIKRVNKVVIPKLKNAIFVNDNVRDLGIIFETPKGIGYANEVLADVPNTGLKVAVVDLIDYPEVTLSNGNTIEAKTAVVIQDASGKRKSVDKDTLIYKVTEGDVQLVNADLMLDKSIRIREN